MASRPFTATSGRIPSFPNIRIATCLLTGLSSASRTRRGSPANSPANSEPTRTAPRADAKRPTRAISLFLDHAVASVFNSCDCRTGLTRDASTRAPSVRLLSSLHSPTDVSRTTTVSDGRICLDHASHLGPVICLDHASHLGPVHSRHLVVQEQKLVGVAALFGGSKSVEYFVGGAETPVA